MRPGDVGEVFEEDSSTMPFHIKSISGAKVGNTWWYAREAVVIAPDLSQPDSSQPDSSVDICMALSKEDHDLNVASMLLVSIRSILSQSLLIDVCGQAADAASRSVRIQRSILESFHDDYIEMVVQLAIMLPRSTASYSLKTFFMDLCTALIRHNRTVSDFARYSIKASTSSQSQLFCPNQHPLKLVSGSKISKKGRPAIGAIGLGKSCTTCCKRVPKPPARTTASRIIKAP